LASRSVGGIDGKVGMQDRKSEVTRRPDRSPARLPITRL